MRWIPDEIRGPELQAAGHKTLCRRDNLPPPQLPPQVSSASGSLRLAAAAAPRKASDIGGALAVMGASGPGMLAAVPDASAEPPLAGPALEAVFQRYLDEVSQEAGQARAPPQPWGVLWEALPVLSGTCRCAGGNPHWPHLAASVHVG